MPSIISNVDIGQSFNNVSRQGDNIGRDQLDIDLNELFTFDVFCGTECSGINLEKEFCYIFCEIEDVGTSDKVEREERNVGDSVNFEANINSGNVGANIDEADLDGDSLNENNEANRREEIRKGKQPICEEKGEDVSDNGDLTDKGEQINNDSDTLVGEEINYYDVVDESSDIDGNEGNKSYYISSDDPGDR